jgi:hypothetical protein
MGAVWVVKVLRLDVHADFMTVLVKLVRWVEKSPVVSLSAKIGNHFYGCVLDTFKFWLIFNFPLVKCFLK